MEYNFQNYTMVNNHHPTFLIFLTLPICWICICMLMCFGINIYKNQKKNMNILKVKTLSEFKKFKDNINQINDNCIICYDDFNDKECIILDCKHKFHLSCIDKWFLNYDKNFCPLCKENIC